MNKSKTYLIKLQPADTYFFGGEITFGEGKSVNYHVKSNLMPQQTALLGLVRYILLNQDERVKFEKEMMHDLIGNSGFNNTTDQQFGKIKRISPVFINRDDTMFYLSSKEYVGSGNGYKLVELDNTKAGKTYTGGEEIRTGIPAVKHYKPKKKFVELFVDVSNPSINVPLINTAGNGVFIPVEAIGINKKQTGGTDDNSMFKMISYKLSKEFEFAFYVEFNEEVYISDEMINFGAKQSVFALRAVANSQFNFDQYQDESLLSKPGKIVLLSDTVAEPSIYEKCSLALTETTDFRHILKFEDSNNFASRPQKSLKFNMLKRGSVLYTDNVKELAFELQKNKQFTTIGYNYFKITYSAE